MMRQKCTEWVEHNMTITPYEVPNIPSLYNSSLASALGGLKEVTSGYMEGQQQKYTRQQEELKNALLQKQAQSEMDYRAIQGQKDQQQMQYNPQIWQSETDLRNAQARLTGGQADVLPNKTQAEIDELNARAKYYNQGQRGVGGSSSKYDTAIQKDLYSFQNQLRMENPNWSDEDIQAASSAYLKGEKQFNGNPLPPLSGVSQTFLTAVQKRSSNAAIQNQATLMDEISNQLNNTDITPATKFTGITGKLKEGYNAFKSGIGLEPSEDYNSYQVFKDQAIESMDSLRSALKTSVVPRYVTTTLGQLSNPNSSIWSNPKLVEQRFNQVKEWVANNAKNLKIKSTQGVSAELGNNNNESSSEKGTATNPIKVVKVNGKYQRVS